MSTISSPLILWECNLLRKSELIQVKRTKKVTGRSQIIIVLVKKDMSIKGVTNSIGSNRLELRKTLHLAKPN